MTKLNWINELSDKDVQNLVKSVDTVLFDIDGVLLHDKTVLSGSEDAVVKLRKLGKKIGFVTNNTLYSINHIKEGLKPFDAAEEEITTPTITFLAYLKKINFQKDIYIVGGLVGKTLLKEAGYNVIEYKDIQSVELEDNIGQLKKVASRALDMCSNVGIVYLDLDFNVEFGAVHIATVILNHRNDIQLITGPSDEKIPIDESSSFIGPAFYIDAVKKMTNKNPLEMAKPGLALTDLINLKFKISDKSCVLMVGDNPKTDIAWGVNSGFKTCLLLSGVWKKDQVDNWKLSEECKPDYVASSLAQIYEKIKDM